MTSAAVATKPTEAEFQSQVIELARTCGWRTLHIRRSIGKGRRWTTTTSLVGWPDLVLMRPPRDLLFIELKVPPHRLTPEQAELLCYLDRFEFATARVWTPDDWDLIVDTLTARGAR